MKKAIVTGITGQDGGYLAKLLLSKNYKVYGLMKRYTAPNWENLDYLGIRNQIEFINLSVQELTQNGVMEPERLFQSPFTDMNAQGPLGVFSESRVMQIVQVLDGIRVRAVA